jgi:hypothetical protein
MKKIILVLFVIIAAPNSLKAQLKFSLTPDRIFTGKSELISNCVKYPEYFEFIEDRNNINEAEYYIVPGYNNRKIWSQRLNRKYNIKYGRYFENFYIEEIGTGRKIILTKPNGEIMKDFDKVIITSTEKIIGFYKNSKYLFFDIQTGRMLPDFINEVNFFSQDKYAIVERENGYNIKTQEYKINSFVFDVEKNDTLFSFSGEFKKFSKDYSMMLTTDGIYNIVDKIKLINSNSVFQGLSDDLKYAFIGRYLVDVKLKKLIHSFDEFTEINSIKNNKISTNYQKVETKIYDLAMVELYAAYKKEIDADFAVFKPKDEFETQVEYDARSVKEKEIVLKKYENLFLEKTNALKRKVAESYTQIELKIDKLDAYIAEKQQFPITINGLTNLITIPKEDARLFKETYLNAKITGIKQLDESGTLERVFNIKIANPNSGVLYNFGEQIKPLYVDDVNLAEIESGIPKLDITAKLIEPSGNNLLDGNESGIIQLNISNSGNGNAKDIRIKINSEIDASGINFDKSYYLSGLAAGKEQVVKLKINADRSIKDGELNLNIEASEYKGFNPAPVKLKFNTQKFQAPSLVFREVSIKEIAGNNNNIIENNEIIEANVLIQNVGQGVANAATANFNFSGDNNIVSTNPTEKTQNLGELLPGRDTLIKLTFAINNKYDGADILPINIKLSEAFNEYGGEFPLKLELKKVIQAAKTISIDGEYSKVTVINEASLTSDVDKNIPVDTSINNFKYALIIGNENYNKYQSGLKSESNVEFAINDAFAFKKYAESTLGVPQDHITYITDALSTKMKSELDKLVALSNIESLKNNIEIIFYYAGHGFPDKETEKGYLIPVDVTGSSVSDGVALSELYKKLSNENVKKASIFLDACFSGGGRNEGLAPGRGIMIKSKDEEIQNGNLVVFTASSGDQKSYPFKEKGHGMFTYYLLKKLQETKGNVSFDELAKYIKDNVEQNSLLKNNSLQNPSILISSQISEVWKNWSLKN